MAAKTSSRFQVFFSYDPQDREAAQELSTLLQKEGFEVWDPDRRIYMGVNWAREIGKAADLQENLRCVS
ncbi:MAG: toll/interleukin-1 receptor domain-containing protein [Planctomycetes bacterium]|nr:toll/interleukin-1 receptor domain-containing protein [Planctomycetota bacterium]